VAGIEATDIDAVAVTYCPGLIGGLLVGVVAAKTLAYILQKPLIGVNHLEGHALSAYIDGAEIENDILLLVSGGHCQIINIKGYDEYRIMGQTLDDALGEAFDKVAKMLGLPYPGGAYVEKLAKDGDAYRYDFPKPLYGKKGCDFSFSGLKTAVRREIMAGEFRKEDICASFQRVAGEVIADRLQNALNEAGQGANLIVAGGVAANQYLRSILQEIADKFGRRLLAPPLNLCTDNAAMIAYAGGIAKINGKSSNFSLEPKARI
jgi:N6-L-threonylcarbamoyladenine synthase